MFNKNEICSIKNQVANSKKDLRFYIQGHFYACAVMNFIRIKGGELLNKKLNTYSNDALYGFCLDCVPSCNQKCEDILFVKEQISRVGRYYNQ